ncbi:MAG: hypothetical protein KDE27_14265 [Planctomycetes bacterium]|nr:hypothetical protein [Planctomycetota bacterium]
MNRAAVLVGSGILLGALVGAAVVTAFTNQLGVEPAPASEHTHDAGRLDTSENRPSADTGTARKAPASERDPVPAGASDGGFEVLLGDFVRSEVAAGWRKVRNDTIPPERLEIETATAVEQILALPAAIGEGAARDTDRSEAANLAFGSGDGVGLLTALRDNPSGATRFVGQPGFARLFDPRGGGVGIAGPDYEAGSALAPGTVLSYPAGMFEVGDLARGNDEFPSDITLRGAGMDVTLLFVAEQNMRSSVERFRIEDCTVYADGGITDLRSKPAVFALHRVRVIGFDCGAGGSYALSFTAGAALHATECRFEGGYGRSPSGYANLARVSGPWLARFDRCTFERMSLDHVQAGTVFDSCTMTDLHTEPSSRLDLRNCRVTLLAAEHRRDRESRTRDLNTLFPQFGGTLRPR